VKKGNQSYNKKLNKNMMNKEKPLIDFYALALVNVTYGKVSAYDLNIITI
jgi:hypothetical protein